MTNARLGEIRDHQLAALRELVAALIPANPFYTSRWEEGGCGRLPESLEQFFACFPFTTKSDLVADQETHPPYGTNLTFPLERYTRCHQTSGTTGRPLRWLDTAESWQWMIDNWKQTYGAAGVGAGDRLFFAFSFGPFLGFWTAYEAALQLGCFCLPGGGMSSDLRLAAMEANRINVLCCTPTYALRLAEVAGVAGFDLGRIGLKRLVVAGEPGGSIGATRERLEQTWKGAQICDHHGMTEVGPVSYPCPVRRDVLHVMERAYLPEVLMPGSGRPAAPGQQGELVLTTLGRTGSPLVRYRTGDIVLAGAGEECECGALDLALEGGILGRADDMVILRGVNLYPTAVEDVVRRFPEVAEFRVTLHRGPSLARLEIAIEPVPDAVDPPELAQRVEGALRLTFGLGIPVSIAPPGTLPRPDLKARRWIEEDESE